MDRQFLKIDGGNAGILFPRKGMAAIIKAEREISRSLSKAMRTAIRQ
jgi:hypothetical protein